MYGQISKRWGQNQEELDSIDLLAKKDQQIRRLQAEVQEQRRRAQNALKMLQSYKNINNQSQQASQGLRNEVTRRMRAEQQIKKLKKKNEQLQNGLKDYIKVLEGQLEEKKSKFNRIPDIEEE